MASNEKGSGTIDRNSVGSQTRETLSSPKAGKGPRGEMATFELLVAKKVNKLANQTPALVILGEDGAHSEVKAEEKGSAPTEKSVPKRRKEVNQGHRPFSSSRMKAVL